MVAEPNLCPETLLSEPFEMVKLEETPDLPGEAS